MNILEALLEIRGKYIVIMSAAVFSDQIKHIFETIGETLNAIRINGADMSMSTVKEEITKSFDPTRPIIIFLTSAPKEQIKFPVDFHIHLSGKGTENQEYKLQLETNYINKYYNFNKKDHVLELFKMIMGNIERKLYGKDFEEFKSTI